MGVIVWVCGCDCVGESGSVYLWQPSLTVCVWGGWSVWVSLCGCECNYVVGVWV